MELSFRWFGPEDPVPLAHIGQIPGVRGIVSALYDIPVGEVWPRSRLEQLAETVSQGNLTLSVIESIPVHEDIKLGRPDRERYTERYCRSIEAMGAVGVPVLCYNFMPVFDWMRTDLARRLPDGSTALAYDDGALAGFDLSRGTGVLPGWAARYDAAALEALLAAYRDVSPERLWENLSWFLERIVPVAAAGNVKLAVHPDDPPWPIFGLPRILGNLEGLTRLLRLVDQPANGITFCTGSLAADLANHLPTMITALGPRIHFAHCRNIAVTGPRQFVETPHPTGYGDVDMGAVLQALRESGFRGPLRSDHGRMIWGESGRPGYGLYDRALGATYLYGLWEGLSR